MRFAREWNREYGCRRLLSRRFPSGWRSYGDWGRFRKPNAFQRFLWISHLDYAAAYRCGREPRKGRCVASIYGNRTKWRDRPMPWEFYGWVAPWEKKGDASASPNSGARVAGG